MSADLPGEIWPEDVDRIVLDEVDSTNAEAARRAPGLARPTWIMARRQTAARGRRGRAWAMAEGNFAATLVFRPEMPAAEAARLSYVAALATYMALRDVADHAGYALKWPNDVLLNGGKVAGILLESSGPPQRLDYLAIGIGVNLVAAPVPEAVEPGAARPASILAETGQRVAPEELLARLAVHAEHHLKTVRDAGFGAIRDTWLRRAARIGQTVTARTATAQVTGIFETIDDTGALVLLSQGRRIAIPAADIYF